MSPDTRHSRRRVLQLSGVAAATTILAGCSDGGPGEGEENGNGEGNESGGGDRGGGGGRSGEPIEPGEISLGGETAGWQGVEPEQIADQDNPTLTLQEGEAYEITWENLDGVGHNLEIRDDSGEVIDDYQTEIMEEQGKPRRSRSTRLPAR